MKRIISVSFFVQQPERVAALAFVMTCCLLVYSALKYRIRRTLEKENKTIPDQKTNLLKSPLPIGFFSFFQAFICSFYRMVKI